MTRARTSSQGWTVLAVLAIVGLITTGTTYAAFSDKAAVHANRASAAAVTFGALSDSGPVLEFHGLLPGEPVVRQFQVGYAGTVSADLGLKLSNDGAADYCSPNAAGGEPLAGGAVEVSLNGGEWLSVCSLFSATEPLPLDRVAPSEDLTVTLATRLRPGTDQHYDRRADDSVITVTAQQTVSPGGFTDYAAGTMSITTGTILPPLPAECGDPSKYGTPPQRLDAVVWGTVDDDTLVVEDRGNHPHIVMGLRGDDVIVGGNSGDCLVGGYGNDHLTGGNAKDILLGGSGDDFLDGGRAKDKLNGQDDRDLCDGGLGKDELVNCPPEAMTIQAPTEPPASKDKEEQEDLGSGDGSGDGSDRGAGTDPADQNGGPTEEPEPASPPKPTEESTDPPPPADPPEPEDTSTTEATEVPAEAEPDGGPAAGGGTELATEGQQ